MMTKSEQINELAAALVKAQAAVRPAIKDSVNPHFRSKYADLTSVWEACREALTSNGLSIVQMPEQGPDADSISLTTILLHASGQYISGTVTSPLARRDAQGVGSALTYLRRYALAAMVGVVADEDDDGNSAVGNGSAPRPASRPAAPQPAAKNEAPRDASEAEQRFYARYGEAIGGKTWQAVQRYLGHVMPRPNSIEDWIAARQAAQ
jgi:hypothetical protein